MLAGKLKIEPGGVPRQFQRNEPAFKPIDLATGGAAEQPQESQESQQRIQELERELALMKQMQALSQTQVPPVQPIRTQVLPTQLAAPVLPPQSTALPEDDDAEPRLHRYESGCIVVQGGVTLNLSLGAPCGTAAGAPAARAPQPPVRVPISTQTLPNAATNPIGLLAPLRSFSKAGACKRAQAQRIIRSSSTSVLVRAATMAPCAMRGCTYTSSAVWRPKGDRNSQAAPIIPYASPHGGAWDGPGMSGVL